MVRDRAGAATCGSGFAAGSATRSVGGRRSRVVTALLTAGLFEYNFGDSEVLMLFLIIVTLPRGGRSRVRRPHPRA